MIKNKHSTYFDCMVVLGGPKNSFKNGLFTSFLAGGCNCILITLVRLEPAEKKHSKGPWQATACFGGAGWLTWPHYFRHKWAQTSTVDFLTTNLFLAVQRMAWSPLFWAGGCGRIRITLVCPEEIRQMELTEEKSKTNLQTLLLTRPQGSQGCHDMWLLPLVAAAAQFRNDFWHCHHSQRNSFVHIHCK